MPQWRSRTPPKVNLEIRDSPGQHSRSPPVVKAEKQDSPGLRWHSRSPPKIQLERRVSPGPYSHSRSPPLHNVEQIVFEFYDKEIQLTFRRTPDRIIPLECQLLGPHPGVPDLEYRKHHNYIARAIVIDKDTKCVAYIAGRVGHEIVLGVKLAPTATTFFPRGK